MRTTLDIADDVLMAVKERARRQKRSAGDLLSELAREALTHRYREDPEIKKPKSFYGFDPLPPRGRAVSNELIDKLREEDLGVMRALLDINVLLALLDADHVDHQRAQEWISGEIQHGWASCALTQNGFVRIISQPKYPSPVSPSEAVERLRRATNTEYHEFWPCSISLLEDRHINSSHVHGPRQVTDVYLLALAVEHGGRFVTFDGSIPPSAAPGATPEHLVVV